MQFANNKHNIKSAHLIHSPLDIVIHGVVEVLAERRDSGEEPLTAIALLGDGLERLPIGGHQRGDLFARRGEG